MKTKKLVHWVFTGLLSAMLLMAVTMYVVKHDDIAAVFEGLGYPGYLVYSLSIAKLGAVIMLLTKFHKTLTEWAYAGVTITLFLDH